MNENKVLLKIDGLIKAKFVSRPNRYLSIVELNGQLIEVHVHDPGRLKELLYEGNVCLIKFVPSVHRKTSWDMIAAQKDGAFVMVHSGYHRYIAEAILKDSMVNPFGQFESMKAEAKHGKSRIDFLAKATGDERPIWVEVKGCSLSVGGVAMFPDAPTVRGTRHLEELMAISESGDRAGVLILVLSESKVFVPKKDTDPKFYKTFYEAIDKGVEIVPVQIEFFESGVVKYGGILPIKEV
ncbi:MAG TPA: DNA/RNA nuclease SfsA, partial [Clostridiales bacterium UBA8960]|nr:DNA/RNA nuclease SfsA [Clostridiales bacterium UBA8960]